jgi:hypothetical protein
VLCWGLDFRAPPDAARVHLRADGAALSALSALSTGATAATTDLRGPQLQLFFAATELHLNLLYKRRSEAQSAAAEERGRGAEERGGVGEDRRSEAEERRSEAQSTAAEERGRVDADLLADDGLRKPIAIYGGSCTCVLGEGCGTHAPGTSPAQLAPFGSSPSTPIGSHPLTPLDLAGPGLCACHGWGTRGYGDQDDSSNRGVGVVRPIGGGGGRDATGGDAMVTTGATGPPEASGAPP